KARRARVYECERVRSGRRGRLVVAQLRRLREVARRIPFMQLVVTPPVRTSATRLVTLAHAGFLLPIPSVVSTGRPQAAMRSAARRRALLARGFSAISASVGVSDGRVTRRRRGDRPQTQTGSSGGQMQPLRSASRNLFTMRSSSE